MAIDINTTQSPSFILEWPWIPIGESQFPIASWSEPAKPNSFGIVVEVYTINWEKAHCTSCGSTDYANRARSLESSTTLIAEFSFGLEIFTTGSTCLHLCSTLFQVSEQAGTTKGEWLPSPLTLFMAICQGKHTCVSNVVISCFQQALWVIRFSIVHVIGTDHPWGYFLAQLCGTCYFVFKMVIYRSVM